MSIPESIPENSRPADKEEYEAWEKEGARSAAMRAIIGERDYQEKKWPGSQHSVAEWLLIIEKLCSDARREWVTGHGNNGALHEVRQITATGLACLEQCGAPLREEPVSASKYPRLR